MAHPKNAVWEDSTMIWATLMYNSYSGIKNRIFKEKKNFFEIFDFSKILKKLIFVKNFEIFEKISKMASPGLF